MHLVLRQQLVQQEVGAGKLVMQSLPLLTALSHFLWAKGTCIRILALRNVTTDPSPVRDAEDVNVSSPIKLLPGLSREPEPDSGAEALSRGWKSGEKTSCRLSPIFGGEMISDRAPRLRIIICCSAAETAARRASGVISPDGRLRRVLGPALLSLLLWFKVSYLRSKVLCFLAVPLFSLAQSGSSLTEVA